MIKAVDPDDESIVTAFGVWGKICPESPGEEVKEIDRDRGMQIWKHSGGMVVNGLAIRYVEGEKKKSLGEYLAARQEVILDAWTKDVRHVELMVLMTDPVFQRRGIGTALLKWGDQFAAREGVPAFLGASPFGFRLYRSLGWNVVAEVEVDLKDWVQGAEEGDMGWGVYKNRFMVRLPRVGDL